MDVAGLWDVCVLEGLCALPDHLSLSTSLALPPCTDNHQPELWVNYSFVPLCNFTTYVFSIHGCIMPGFKANINETDYTYSSNTCLLRVWDSSLLTPVAVIDFHHYLVLIVWTYLQFTALFYCWGSSGEFSVFCCMNNAAIYILVLLPASSSKGTHLGEGSWAWDCNLQLS